MNWSVLSLPGLSWYGLDFINWAVLGWANVGRPELDWIGPNKTGLN